MANWMDVLPAVGGFLGGPAGSLVGSGVEWLASKFGASDKTVEGIKQTIAGMKPEDLLSAKKIDIEFQEFCLDHDIKLQLGQIDINKNEALSTNWFVAGARPAIMWICAAALAYTAVAEPFIRFIATVWFGYKGTYPVINTDLTMQVMMGILGLGVYRTAEKIKGAEGNR